jgi:outer membrane protein
VLKRLGLVALLVATRPLASYGQVVSLTEAIHAAQANNRAIQIAELERQKAALEFNSARTRRWPIFSVTALGSQPLSQVGITLERGSLGVYPADGPIPGRTTTLTSPLQFGFIGYVSVAQPLTQQHKIGLGITLAGIAVEASAEQVRMTRQAVVNEVRRLYYGIAQAESGRKTLQAAVDFLRQLETETNQQVMQRVVLREDALNVQAQRLQAEYDLLKTDDPIATQKEQLNRLMGRPIDTPLDIDAAAMIAADTVSLRDASAEALASRPEMRLAKVQQRKAQLERRLASAEFIPDVSLSLSGLRTVNFSSTLPNTISSVGIQATWDVFDWGRKRHTVQEKQDAELQAALQVKEAEASILADVAHHYRRLAEARKEVEVARARQSSGTEALRVLRNRYLQRTVMLSDVTRTESGLAEADHRYVQALADLATAQADFDRAIGRNP